MSIVREKIVSIASGLVNQIGGGQGPDGKLKGWDLLKKIFEEAAPGLISQWTPNRVAALQQGMWIIAGQDDKGNKDGGTYNETYGIMWCGVFATWVLQQAGLQVNWVNQQIMGPPSEIIRIYSATQDDRDKLIPGDIGVLTHRQHHFIVIGWKPKSKRVDTVEGNVGVQSIQQKTQMINDSTIYSIYKPRGYGF